MTVKPVIVPVLVGLMTAVDVGGVSSAELDLTRYAMTQGGLLIVVLVLLYWQRIDQRNKNRENQDKISVLTGIAERSASAAEASSKASEANAAAIHRLSSAVESFQHALDRSR